MFFMRADPLRGQVGGGWATSATVPLLYPLCQDKERKDEEDDDEDDDKGDDDERRRKKKTRTVFSRSQVSLLHYFTSFVQ